MADEKYYEELHQQFPTFSVERLKQIEEHYVAIAKQMEGQAGFHMTEAEARKKALDPDRLRRHVKAKNVYAVQNKQMEKKNEYGKFIPMPHSSISRTIQYSFDMSGTDEADYNNMVMSGKFQRPDEVGKNARLDFFKTELKNLYSFDLNKYPYNDMEKFWDYLADGNSQLLSIWNFENILAQGKNIVDIDQNFINEARIRKDIIQGKMTPNISGLEAWSNENALDYPFDDMTFEQFAAMNKAENYQVFQELGTNVDVLGKISTWKGHLTVRENEKDELLPPTSIDNIDEIVKSNPEKEKKFVGGGFDKFLEQLKKSDEALSKFSYEPDDPDVAEDLELAKKATKKVIKATENVKKSATPENLLALKKEMRVLKKTNDFLDQNADFKEVINARTDIPYLKYAFKQKAADDGIDRMAIEERFIQNGYKPYTKFAEELGPDVIPETAEVEYYSTNSEKLTEAQAHAAINDNKKVVMQVYGGLAPAGRGYLLSQKDGKLQRTNAQIATRVTDMTHTNDKTKEVKTPNEQLTMLKAMQKLLKGTDPFYVWTNSSKFDDVKKGLNKIIEIQTAIGPNPNEKQVQVLMNEYKKFDQTCKDYVDMKTDKLKGARENNEYNERGEMRYNIVKSLRTLLTPKQVNDVCLNYDQHREFTSRYMQATTPDEKQQIKQEVMAMDGTIRTEKKVVAAPDKTVDPIKQGGPNLQ